MAEQLKNMYNKAFMNSLCQVLKSHIKNFDPVRFQKDVFTNQWKELELKQRMNHLSYVLHKHLPFSYKKQCEEIIKIVHELKKNHKEQSFEYMFLPDFIEKFGQNDLSTSLVAIEEITQFTSCEFAIRPFLIRNQTTVMKQMLKWSQHKNQNIRRFSSEGCRPRLPWAMALPSLKNDPDPILPILENLKQDESEYVRKSVANNLNDIAKDNPAIVKKLVKAWKGNHPHTDWILKHGSRTLLKKADTEILSLFGLSQSKKFTVSEFSISKKRVQKEGELPFTFMLTNTDKKDQLLRVEYAVYYNKANQKQSRKLFKITENTYSPQKPFTFKRTLSFKDLTTRKHYPGKHKLSVVINGIESNQLDFVLY